MYFSKHRFISIAGVHCITYGSHRCYSRQSLNYQISTQKKLVAKLTEVEIVFVARGLEQVKVFFMCISIKGFQQQIFKGKNR